MRCKHCAEPGLPKSPAGLAGRSVGLQRGSGEAEKPFCSRLPSVVEGAQCTGGREPARQLLPAENCLHRGCSKQPHLFQVAGCHSWDFLLLEFDRFRTRGELGQGRLRADCYLALPDLQTAPPRDDRSDNLPTGFSRTQFCDFVDIAGL